MVVYFVFRFVRAFNFMVRSHEYILYLFSPNLQDHNIIRQYRHARHLWIHIRVPRESLLQTLHYHVNLIFKERHLNIKVLIFHPFNLMPLLHQKDQPLLKISLLMRRLKQLIALHHDWRVLVVSHSFPDDLVKKLHLFFG